MTHRYFSLIVQCVAEIARDHLNRLGQYLVVGGVISPVHDGYGKKELEASTHRLEMLKLALRTSDWIKVSDWECNQEAWSKTLQVLQYHQVIIDVTLYSSVLWRNSTQSWSF